MIYKSYLVEENIENLKNNISLFYGENIGLINHFKDKIKIINKSKKILRLNQEDILKNDSIILNEIKNISLFDDTKIIFIDNVNDRILKTIQEIEQDIDKNKVYLFAEILEKKSKIRSYLESTKNLDLIPCYSDNEINIKKMIINNLKDYSGVTPKLINTIIENNGLDRIKVNNELNKIKTFFINKKIEIKLIEKLLNTKVEEHFNSIKDTVIKGNKRITNKLLASTVFDKDKIPLYINIINQRLNKLKEVIELSNKRNVEQTVNEIKPPIFWKDKPVVIDQVKSWTSNKLNVALKKTYELEIKIKSNAEINKDILIKKLLLDICLIANA